MKSLLERQSARVIEFLDRYSQTLKLSTVVVLDRASIHTSAAILTRLKNGKHGVLPLLVAHLELSVQWVGVVKTH